MTPYSKTPSSNETCSALPKGAAILHNPLFNKGTAFTEAERAALGLQGLLPPHVSTMDEQIQRVMCNYANKTTDLERYIHLASLQDRNETLFYRVLTDHLEQMMPIVYTPTVGLACQKYGEIFRRSRGLFVSYKYRGRIAEILENWPQQDVRVIVMTDGERILGLGDQGSNGMGIPIGKLSLYTACAGICPSQTLPVMLDVGTENEGHLRDRLYLGLSQRRVRGEDYDAFVAEFIEAARAKWPKVLIQFEDFGNAQAFRLLEHWQDRVCTFNDDIQGTASVALAGLFSALRITGKSLREQRVLFLGAGEAGVGIGDLIASAMVDQGATIEEARSRLWFVDSKGLIVKSRSDLSHHKLRYAHDFRQIADFQGAVRALEPTAIIGVSTMSKAFTQPIIELMSQLNERPIIFALSNPTSRSECSADEAYNWSKGKAIFASGSPFVPVIYEGKTFVPGQGNNAYIFPGVGLGVIATEARRVTDRMFSEAARALAAQTSQHDLDQGRIYPSLRLIREVSVHIAAAVAEVAFRDGLAGIDRPADLLGYIRSKVWEPEYRNFA